MSQSNLHMKLAALLAAHLLIPTWSMAASELYSFRQLSGGGLPFDPNLTTVVVTHGVQIGSNAYQNNISTYSAVPLWIAQAMSDMNAYQTVGATPRYNAMAFTYSGAFFTGLSDNPLEVAQAARIGDLTSATAGFSLAGKLATSTAPGSPIHLVGHSLGTHVNAFAALGLVAMGRPVAQVTILDRPFGRLDALQTLDDQLFKYALPNGGVLWVDNYYGGRFLESTGATLRGAYNLDVDASHEGVHSKYMATLNSATEGFAYSPAVGAPRPPPASWRADDIADIGALRKVYWIGGTAGIWGNPENWSEIPAIGPTIPTNGNSNRFAVSVTNGAAIITDRSSYTVDHLFIGLGAEVSLANGSSLTLDSSLGIDPSSGLRAPGVSTVENSGQLKLRGSTEVTKLILDGVITFRGQGILSLSDSANNYIVGGSSFLENWLVNVQGHEISGAGNIMGLSIINGGLISAVGQNPLRIALSSSLINSGELAARDGGKLVLSGRVDNVVGGRGGAFVGPVPFGRISAYGNSFLELSGADIRGGSIYVDDTSSANLSGGGTLENITLNGRLFASQPSLTLRGSLTNNGQLIINTTPPGCCGTVEIDGAVRFTGAGVLELGGGGTNFVYGKARSPESSDRLINEASHTIRGDGELGAISFPRLGTFGLTNSGTIEATTNNKSLVISLGDQGSINTGTIQARNGGTLEFARGAINNGGGLIRSHEDSTVAVSGRISGGDISLLGGTLTLGGGQLVDTTITVNASSPSVLTGQGTFENVVVNGRLFASQPSLTLRGSLTNNGQLIINTTPPGCCGTVEIDGAVRFTGAGVLELGGGGTNFVYGKARSPESSDRLINEASHTIRGDGELGAISFPRLGTFGLTNSGTIEATTNNKSLVISLGDQGSINTGTIQARNGGTLEFARGAINNGGGLIRSHEDSTVAVSGRISGGDISLLGGTLTLGGGQLVDTTITVNASSPSVLTGQGTFENVVVNGRLFASQPSLTLRGSLTNNGQLIINTTPPGCCGTVEIDGAVRFTGAGVLELGGGGTNFVYGKARSPESSDRLINEASHTIRGDGELGAISFPRLGTFGLTNSGTIEATTNNKSLVISLGDQGSINTGTIQARNGGTLEFARGAINNSGTLQVADGGSVFFTGGSLTNNSNGILSGGTYRISSTVSASTLDVGGSGILVNSANVLISGPHSRFQQLTSIALNTGTLSLLDGQQFSTLGNFHNSGSISISSSSLSIAGLYAQTAGSTTLSAGTINADSINIQSGKLSGIGTVQGNLSIGSNGRLEPGFSAGRFVVNGSFELVSGGTIELEIAGRSLHDELLIEGHGTFGGEIRLSFDNFLPLAGDEFLLVSSTQSSVYSTSFALTVFGLGDGYVFHTNFDGNGLSFVVDASPAVPESRTVLLLAVGILYIWRARRRQRHSSDPYYSV